VTLLLAICVACVLGVSVYLMLGRELKEVAMGVFLFSHAAHLGIMAMSGQPVAEVAGAAAGLNTPPVLGTGEAAPVDPLPQALVLTSIVISFAVTAFLLSLLVVTYRRTASLWIDDLAAEDRPATPRHTGESPSEKEAA
jgi:multicomponent Na+:H+ antiporter subunit C